MKKAINVVVENFNTMRTGRANPAILDKIIVRGAGRGGPRRGVAARTRRGARRGVRRSGAAGAQPPLRPGTLRLLARPAARLNSLPRPRPPPPPTPRPAPARWITMAFRRPSSRWRRCRCPTRARSSSPPSTAAG
jgi:hypothetical protein